MGRSRVTKKKPKKPLKPAIRAILPPNKVVRDKTKYTRKKKHKDQQDD